MQRESAQRDRLARTADEGPRVLVARVARPSGERTITLPGDVRSLWQSTLYSKVNGYVASILVDKCDRVRQGQVLARISSPETDEQVRSAAATLALRRRNLDRVSRLSPTGYVSRADLDQATSELRSAGADYQRARALQRTRPCVVDVVPGQTDGHQLQIRQGLAGGEVVALSPPSDLGEGAPVRAVERGAAQAQPAQAQEPARGPPAQRGLGGGGQSSSG